MYWYPSIDDLSMFDKHTVGKADTCWTWKIAKDYNTYELSPEDDAYLNDFRTVSFLVIQNDSIVYEEYRSGWNDTKTSNIFSSTKSIVGLLAVSYTHLDVYKRQGTSHDGDFRKFFHVFNRVGVEV